MVNNKYNNKGLIKINKCFYKTIIIFNLYYYNIMIYNQII